MSAYFRTYDTRALKEAVKEAVPDMIFFFCLMADFSFLLKEAVGDLLPL
jgi:hypothetical protein